MAYVRIAFRRAIHHWLSCDSWHLSWSLTHATVFNFHLSLSITKYINNSVSMARLRLEICLLIMLLFSHFLLSKNAVSRFFSRRFSACSSTLCDHEPRSASALPSKWRHQWSRDRVTSTIIAGMAQWCPLAAAHSIASQRHSQMFVSAAFATVSGLQRWFCLLLVVFHGYGLFPLFCNRKFLCVVHVSR